jgi:hypothetical protein
MNIMANNNANNLPIMAFEAEIVRTVGQHSVTIVVAETGSGKSTMVPVFLMDAGYRKVVVTQPRKLAARTVAQRVAEVVQTPLGKRVGFRTAEERRDSSETEVLFVTDGLQLVRELLGHGGKETVLVLDEVHEWNLNLEVLVAWAKIQVEERSDFKVVLMSATLEAERLSAFFNGAPIVSVPGRVFPVEERAPGESVVDDVATLVAERKTVLVFEPGKAEMESTLAALKLRGVDADLLPLHGGLTPDEQARCFLSYDRPKVVVATNVAQTSITIPDIGGVVDSGMERRIELVDGIEGLYLRPISMADRAQRKGRAGRCGPGVYIDHCPHPLEARSQFPAPEILRSRLDQTVLRLKRAGFNMEELNFFHQPEKAEVLKAREALIRLGCLGAGGEVTPIGKFVSELPVSVQIGRMMFEAKRLGVVAEVLRVAAILEVGGITVPPPSRNRPERPDWRLLVQDERESDVLGQIEAWRLASSMSKFERQQKGISERSLGRAREVHRHLKNALSGFLQVDAEPNQDRIPILKAVCAGMVDHLFRGKFGQYQNGDGPERQLGSSSLVRGYPDFIVGKPFDVDIKSRRGGTTTLRVIELATVVDPRWLVEVAPHLVTREAGISPMYNPEEDQVVSTTRLFFNGQPVSEDQIADGDNPEAAAVFARWLANLGVSQEVPEGLRAVVGQNNARQALARELNARTGENTFQVFSPEEVFEHYCTTAGGARRVSELRCPTALKLPALDEELVDLVTREYPDSIEVLGERTPVQYSTGNPVVTLKLDVGSTSWRELPDDGFHLPGGKAVEVIVALAYYYRFSESSIPSLKAKIAATLNGRQWEQWRKPPIPRPEGDVSAAPISTHVYGQCVLTGNQLTAFGTWGLCSVWGEQTMWFRSLEEAEAAQANTLKNLAALQKKERQREELQQAQDEAEGREKALRALFDHESWSKLDMHVRHSAYRRVLPTSLDGLRRHTAETEALIQRLQAALADFEREESEQAPEVESDIPPGIGFNQGQDSDNEDSSEDASSGAAEEAPLDLTRLFGGNVRVSLRR